MYDQCLAFADFAEATCCTALAISTSSPCQQAQCNIEHGERPGRRTLHRHIQHFRASIAFVSHRCRRQRDRTIGTEGCSLSLADHLVIVKQQAAEEDVCMCKSGLQVRAAGGNVPVTEDLHLKSGTLPASSLPSLQPQRALSALLLFAFSRYVPGSSDTAKMDCLNFRKGGVAL